MICISTDVISSSYCRGRENNLGFAENKVHADGNCFDDLAFASSSFTSRPIVIASIIQGHWRWSDVLSSSIKAWAQCALSFAFRHAGTLESGPDREKK